MKLKTVKVHVMYFDMFEPESFMDAVFDAAKGLPLWRRLFVAGGAARLAEYTPGFLEKNQFYTVTVQYKNPLGLGIVRLEKGLV